MEKIIKKDEFIRKNRNIVFKVGNKQVLLLGVEDKVFALDNRCPHEGYPLSQGSPDSKSCVLTCNWHNWKFDLTTGKCLVGGDSVRTYPVIVSDNEIKIDLSEPSQEEIRNKIIDDFQVAFEKRQYGRISREITRLIFNELDPLYAVEQSILWSFDKFEYGMTHAYAALADWINLYQKLEKIEDKIICLTEGIDHLSFDVLRQPVFPYGSKEMLYSDEELLRAIELEDSELAESLVYSCLKKGKSFSDIEEVLSQAALSHYNDFGHSLIYVIKCSELSRLFKSREIDMALALSLTRSLCYSTKEDLLPEFRNYSKTLNEIKGMKEGKSDKIVKLSGENVSRSYQWFIEHYSETSIKHLYDIILGHNANNFLRFNLRFQSATNNPVTHNINWLDFTHAITFSNAVRITCERYPYLWPEGLLQMISFYGRNTSYLDENISLEQWEVKSLSDFKNEVLEIITDHGLSSPIFSAHIIKTSVAVFEELDYCSEETKSLLLASLNRFLHSPLKQKYVRRTISQGISLVKKDFVQ